MDKQEKLKEIAGVPGRRSTGAAAKSKKVFEKKIKLVRSGLDNKWKEMRMTLSSL